MLEAEVVQNRQFIPTLRKGKEGGEGGKDGRGSEGVPECPNPELASLVGTQ